MEDYCNEVRRLVKLKLRYTSVVFLTTVGFLVLSINHDGRRERIVTATAKGQWVSSINRSNHLSLSFSAGPKIPTDRLNCVFEQSQELGSGMTQGSSQNRITVNNRKRPKTRPSTKSLGGGFDLILVRDPTHLSDQTDRRLEMTFYGSEWSALFFNVLRCPKPRPYLPQEDMDALR